MVSSNYSYSIRLDFNFLWYHSYVELGTTYKVWVFVENCYQTNVKNYKNTCEKKTKIEPSVLLVLF